MSYKGLGCVGYTGGPLPDGSMPKCLGCSGMGTAPGPDGGLAPAETPWALVGLVVLGLGVAYASYKSDEARGYEPNRKGRRGKGKPSDKVRVMIGSEHGPRSRVSTPKLRAEAKKAYAAVSAVGAKKKKMKVWPSSTKQGGKSGHWGVFAVIRRDEMGELNRKLRSSLKTPHVVNYLRMRRR